MSATPSSGGGTPTFSTLDVAAGDVTPNAAVVAVGAAGQFRAFESAGTADLVADLDGWFGPAPT